MGGISGSQSISDCERNAWQTIASLPETNSFFNPVVVEATRTIYVIGGYDDETGGSKNIIEEFS
jgi:hypothetical protein